MRLQAGSLHFANEIFKYTINWINKILATEPQNVFWKVIYVLTKSDPFNKMNQVIQLKIFFSKPCGLLEWRIGISPYSFHLDAERIVCTFAMFFENRNLASLLKLKFKFKNVNIIKCASEILKQSLKSRDILTFLNFYFRFISVPSNLNCFNI